MTAAAVRLLLVLGLCCPSFSFSSSFYKKLPVRNLSSVSASPALPDGTNIVRPHSRLLGLRGGNQERPIKDSEPSQADSDSLSQTKTRLSSSLAPMASALASLGTKYGSYLQQYPIRTKSLTAGAIFALSDWLAQRLETSSDDSSPKKTNWTRTISSALVGLLYFGPAAHAWYETIFKLLPGTSLVSTLQKAALGQLLFGPSFTCIFFATSLLQQGNFSLQNWWDKIKTNLPGAWVAGLGFWPLVDLVSYSLIPKNWIPLFVNTCSLAWTVYLSIVANRQSSTSKQS